jgi:MarR family transcriptional regulator for hemolysin
MKHIEYERNIPFLIHDLSRLMRKAFDKHMEPLGITRSQWWVLAYLYREDGMTQVELADILDLGKVALSGLLDRLETKGWIERRADAMDRRAKRVFLTEQASEITEEMMAQGRVMMEGVLVDMSKDEHHQLADLLMGLKFNMLKAGYGPQLTIVDGSKKVAKSSFPP